MKPRFNLWLEEDGQVVLSPWRVRLLQAVAETGSISAAAGAIGAPYRRAWEKIQEMEAGLGVRLLETTVGGSGGGGATLTPAGRDYVERFQRLIAGLEAEIQQRFHAAFESPP